MAKIDVQLIENLWRASASSSRHVEAMLQELMECSVPQLLVLRTLAAQPAQEGALAASDVARALGCSKANAGQLVNRLEERGRLKKVSGGADGRVVALRITPRGAEAHSRGEEQLATEAKRIFGKLDAREKQQLLALLEKVTSPS